MGRYCGAPTAAGWGEDCCQGRAADIIAVLESSKSLLQYSDLITHIHMN